MNLNPQESFNILKARKKKTYFINILSSKVGRQETLTIAGEIISYLENSCLSIRSFLNDGKLMRHNESILKPNPWMDIPSLCTLTTEIGEKAGRLNGIQTFSLHSKRSSLKPLP